MPHLDPTNAIFGRLDAWRHLPAYQLERRADIFFAIYLREVVSAFTGVALSDTIIPELPLKRDLIWPQTPGNQSVKLDYCLFAADGSRVFFVELKTDDGSRRAQQDEYLTKAAQLGFRAIVAGIRDIVLATTAHQKYHHLVALLAGEGLLDVPPDLSELLYPKPQRGLKERLRQLTVTDRDPSIEVLYIQPTATDHDRCIDFAEFAKHVEVHQDPFSQAFAEHLRRWAVTPAGAELPR